MERENRERTACGRQTIPTELFGVVDSGPLDSGWRAEESAEEPQVSNTHKHRALREIENRMRDRKRRER